eukprot:g2571.t1
MKLAEERVTFLRKKAREMIRMGLSVGGLRKKAQIKEYTQQLDNIESALRAWELQGRGTMAQMDVFLKKRCGDDTQGLESLWALDILALIELGALREDNMNGPYFQSVPSLKHLPSFMQVIS